MIKTFLKFSVLFLCVLSFQFGHAHEGMWIPSTLAKLVEGDMQNAGLKLSAEDIYSINQSSLKDAIVHFGGGCTASVISEEGLILTNHHCGYSQIQSHSSVENDYLKNGFWAMNHGEELQNPNLTATFVVRIEDVTEFVEKRTKGLKGDEKMAAIADVTRALEKGATEGNGYEASVKPFFYGNAYYMIVTETYRDVRLVGAPPSSIGKFGGDTDNWEWPRHTGDFSLFRIYAAPDNSPADYSVDNVPYTPKYSLPVNMDGLKEGDFTMVFGFPGSTDQYLSSYGVKYITEVQNPVAIAMREASLSVIDAAMESSDKLRIQYAAKQSRISNAYKKWIGQNMGLERFDAVEKKEAQEKLFVDAARAKGFDSYAALPDEFAVLYSENEQYQLARTFLIEFFYYGPEAIRFSTNFKKLASENASLTENGKMKEEKERLRNSIAGFNKDYDAETDRRIMAAQLAIFAERCPDVLNSPTLNTYLAKYGNSKAAADAIYDESMMDNEAGLLKLLDLSGKKQVKILNNDPIYKIGDELLEAYNGKVRAGYENFVNRESEMMEEYVKATMELFPNKKYWPDANSTMRLTYGKMEGSEPQDGLEYKAYTTLDGIVQKYIPGDKEFDVPERLLELQQNGDYGKYATDGELRVCFLGSNHTTGGNSGSPALDGKGQLVGLNFDRTWESTMSDLMFNGEICRNIMVDVKYVLFIVDKFAGAGHLVDEMKLVSSAGAESSRGEQKTVEPVTN
ncbi:S46 family peptidase [Cryomorpha ignava]|nr:S46 family peptidase [Cryomorpha ignava]